MNEIKKIDRDGVRFFCGSSNPQFAADLCQCLDVPLETTFIKRFSNDNLNIQLGTSVRKHEAYIIQSLSRPVDKHLMELFIMLDIARSSGARDVHAVIPYFSYARSDKKDASRISISARLIAELLQTSGANHVMTMMLHSPQVHGFFHVPTDHLTSETALEQYVKSKNLVNAVMVMTDVNAMKSGSRLAKHMGDLPIVGGIKERISDTTVEITDFVGVEKLKNRETAIVYDDEIATGGTIFRVCELLIERGIKNISVVCTHGAFAGGTLKKIDAIPEIKEVISTDTVFIPLEERIPKLHILSVAPLFAEAIRLNYWGESISSIFAFGDKPA